MQGVDKTTTTKEKKMGLKKVIANLAIMLAGVWLLFFIAIWMRSPAFSAVAIIVGVLTSLVGGLFILKSFSKNRASVPAIHWVDVFVNIIWMSFATIIITGALSFVLLYFGGFFFGQALSMAFSGICLLFLLVGWILSGLYIRQAVVTEGTLKALEMYEGSKRSKQYGEKSKK